MIYVEESALPQESIAFRTTVEAFQELNRRLAVQTCWYTLQSHAPDQQSWRHLLRSEQSCCMLLFGKVSHVTVADAELLLRQACMSAPLFSIIFAQGVMLWEPVSFSRVCTEVNGEGFILEGVLD